jgi:hypothetical protein
MRFLGVRCAVRHTMLVENGIHHAPRRAVTTECENTTWRTYGAQVVG